MATPAPTIESGGAAEPEIAFSSYAGSGETFGGGQFFRLEWTSAARTTSRALFRLHAARGGADRIAILQHVRTTVVSQRHTPRANLDTEPVVKDVPGRLRRAMAHRGLIIVPDISREGGRDSVHVDSDVNADGTVYRLTWRVDDGKTHVARFRVATDDRVAGLRAIWTISDDSRAVVAYGVELGDIVQEARNAMRADGFVPADEVVA